jgi:hypothetical protein
MNTPEAKTNTPRWLLERDVFGRLCLLRAVVGAPMEDREIVVPVRAFPLTVSEGCISLVGLDGSEKAWIERLADLPQASRELIEEELALRHFVPELTRLDAVSTFATPSLWSVQTDRGPTQFTLKSEDDLRRLDDNGYLVASADGVQFRIHDRTALDRHSRKLLDRFL